MISLRARGAWLAALALLCLAMFADVLMAPRGRVLGSHATDMAYQFLQWRDFGFSQIAAGQLPLWNPHIYGGAPFFGGMQSALLYPPNWLYMVLPLEAATNWTIALDVWLLGAFMFLWGARRGLHPFAAFVSAALLMFCAPHFLRIAAGHATNLAAMAWVPLIFLSIDGWLHTRRWSWCLLGMLAVAMQIFAGHPQYVYFTALIAAVYVLLRIVESGTDRAVSAAGAGAMYIGGALLAAVQLLPAIEATSETIRDLPLPFELAASFGFPPENLVTLVAPGFFGDTARASYWGRWLPWEANAFIGVGGLMLASLGVAHATFDGRRSLLVTAALSTVLALSPSTPLFRLLYEWIPLFDKFRASGKFMFFTALFLALFAGVALDRLLRERRLPRRAMIAAAGTILVLLGGAILARLVDWYPIIALSLASGDSYMAPSRYLDEAFVHGARDHAAWSLLIAAVVLAVFTAAALWGRTEPRAIFLVGVLSIAEVFMFARLHRPTFDGESKMVEEVTALLARDPGDYRILNVAHPNSALVTGAYDGWGYDPSVTRRYAELMQWMQGEDVSRASQHLVFHGFHPLHGMLRIRYRIEEKDGGALITRSEVPELRQVELIGAHRVRTSREEVFAALKDPRFDPSQEVILERDPVPAPGVRRGRGRAEVMRQGTDFLEIQAEVLESSVLLVTDAWTPAWRARALPGSASERYDVMPANYALRAVPLGPGTHRLRLEYAPTSLRVGTVLSIVSVLAWLVAVYALTRPHRNLPHA
jgi:hypothetical protein